jgi:Na+/melibiose symporter-like transporter
MGLIGAAFGLGFAVGPALGGLLGHFAHSLPAFAAALCSAIAAWQTWRFLPESKRHVHIEEAEAWLHPSRFLPILRNAVLVQLILLFFFSMMAFVMMEATFALFMNDVFGYRELAVGLLFALAGVTIALMQGRIVPRWSKRVGEWPLVIAGPLCVTARDAAAGVHALPRAAGAGDYHDRIQTQADGACRRRRSPPWSATTATRSNKARVFGSSTCSAACRA